MFVKSQWGKEYFSGLREQLTNVAREKELLLRATIVKVDNQDKYLRDVELLNIFIQVK